MLKRIGEKMYFCLNNAGAYDSREGHPMDKHS